MSGIRELRAIRAYSVRFSDAAPACHHHRIKHADLEADTRVAAASRRGPASLVEATMRLNSRLVVAKDPRTPPTVR